MAKINKLAQERRFVLKGMGFAALLGTTSFLPILSTKVLAQESNLGEAFEGLLEKSNLQEQVLGKEDAPITVIEYASMTCGHCANFHTTILPKIKENYIDTGKIKLIFREFPSDPLATAAFMLARCAPEGKYFSMIDVLFNQQETWVRSDDPAAALLKISRLAGFTKESFNSCLSDEKLLADINEVRNRGLEKFKVNGTPSFFINGKRYQGQYSVKSLSETFDALGAN